MVGLRWGSSTDSGRVRPVNQDSVLAEWPLFVIADGMGGHAAGEVASQVALLTLRQRVGQGHRPRPADLVAAVQMANAAVLRRAEIDPALRGMGTTLCGIALTEHGNDSATWITLVNVGDSRGYVHDGDGLAQLTRDHSYVEDLVAAGEITPDEARTHPRRHIVTRALGVEPGIPVDKWERLARPGERYLMCSDGLTNELDDAVIAAVLDSEPDPQRAADLLVRLANEQGGRDNISVVLVDITEHDEMRGDAHIPVPIGGWVPDDLRDTVRDAVPPVSTADLAAPASASAPQPPFIDAPAMTVPTIAPPPPAPTTSRQARRQRAPSRWRTRLRNVMFVVALVAILATAFGAIQAYGRAGYYVTFRQDRVTLYRGRPEGLLWVKPYARAAYPNLRREQLTAEWQTRIDDKITFTSRAAADRWFQLLSANPDAVPSLSTTTAATTTTTTTTATTSTSASTSTSATPTTPSTLASTTPATTPVPDTADAEPTTVAP
jgi:PPM family protein phosphatase